MWEDIKERATRLRNIGITVLTDAEMDRERLLADAEALLDFRQKATWLVNNEADAFLREYLREALAALPDYLREQGEG